MNNIPLSWSVMTQQSHNTAPITFGHVLRYLCRRWRTLIGFSAYDPSEKLLLTMGSISSYNLNEGNYTCVIYTLKRLSKCISIWYDRFNLVMWYRGFKTRSGLTEDYNIGICFFSAKHAALMRKSKDWLARNQDNVSSSGDMSICGLLLQWAITIQIQLRVLV
jgi:hypothetical protein